MSGRLYTFNGLSACWEQRALRCPRAGLPAGLAQFLAGSAISPEGQRVRHVPMAVEAHAQSPHAEAEATVVHRASSSLSPGLSGFA